jgi:hypothetical protein
MFQKNDLEGEHVLPYGVVKRILADQNMDITPSEHDFMVAQKLVFSKHSDEYVHFRNLL